VLLAKLQADLREFIILLNSHDVEFLVVGGHAVAFHGHPRYTGDIDFLIRPTQDNARRVLDVLTAFGFGNLGIAARDLLEPGRIVQLGHAPNRVDLLASISGVDFDSAWKTRVPTTLDDQPVSMIGWDELLAKLLAVAKKKDAG